MRLGALWHAMRDRRLLSRRVRCARAMRGVMDVRTWTRYKWFCPQTRCEMYFIAQSSKSFEQAAQDLDAAVKRNGFGVLHVHDLGATLRGKGIDFAEQCKVFEVCNPAQAAKVLSADMRLNMALPCRISVYTEQGQTRLGLITPVKMLTALSQDPALEAVARDVEEKTIRMIEEAK